MYRTAISLGRRHHSNQSIMTLSIPFAYRRITHRPAGESQICLLPGIFAQHPCARVPRASDESHFPVRETARRAIMIMRRAMRWFHFHRQTRRLGHQHTAVAKQYYSESSITSKLHALKWTEMDLDGDACKVGTRAKIRNPAQHD